MITRRTGEGSGEDDLIARYFRPLATHPGALSLEDDAAFLTPPPGHDLVLTKDAIVAGIHFFADDPPHAIARKALRVNLSDLAAKGARPTGFLLALALPADIGDDWLANFASGLSEDAASFGCPLFGGDTVCTDGPVTISITAIGHVPHGAMVRRRGAKVGDIVAVTGTIGDAALGLVLRTDVCAAERWGLDEQDRVHLAQRYLLPQPRLAMADILRAHATAAMDISDGLAGDLGKLCRVSGVSASVRCADVPLSQAARRAVAVQQSPLETVLAGGDDYEILFTVADESFDRVKRDATKAGIDVTRIGIIVAGGDAPVFIGDDGKALALSRTSFSHF